MPSAIQKLAEAAGHELEWSHDGKRVTCRLCHQMVHASRYRPWLRAGQCPGKSDFIYSGGFGECGLLVGRSTLHPSHDLVWALGIWICWCCGAYAATNTTSRPKKLGRPCAGHRMPRGRLNLSRWWKGKHPKDGAWLQQHLPDQELQPHMFPGQRVKIIGLRSAFGIHLNGKEGTLKKYDPLLGR